MIDKGFTPIDKSFTPPSPASTSGKAVASLACGLLSFCFSVFAAIPALILGLFALREIRDSQGQLRGSGLAVVGILLSLVGGGVTIVVAILAIIPVVQAARNATHVVASSKNLKRIGLAMQNYHDAHKSFPLAGSEDKKLGIGLSWRVRVLPFIEQRPLFEKFDFNSPWDSPHNKSLIEEMPAVFKAPGVALEEGKTVYLGVLGESRMSRRSREPAITFFESGGRSTRISDIIDGTANTVVVVEADASEAAIWTRPDDWEFDPQAPRRGIGSLRKVGVTSLFADGSVALVPNTTSDEDFRRLFSIQDGKRFETYVPPYFQHGKR